MSETEEELPKPSHISTLCPFCGELCTWYRLPTLLYSVCPIHGHIDEIQLPTPPNETVS